MPLEPLAKRELPRILLERGHIRRRRIRWLSDDLPCQPRPALYRVRFPTVRQPSHDCCLREHAPKLAPAVRDGNKLEAALGLFGQVVVAGDHFIRDARNQR